MTRKRVLHPGWECCDPTKDLNGWLKREREYVAETLTIAAGLHDAGRRLKAKSIDAGNTGAATDLLEQSRQAHLLGNCYGQDALIRAGHADRVEAAHPHRLNTA